MCAHWETNLLNLIELHLSLTDEFILLEGKSIVLWLGRNNKEKRQLRTYTSPIPCYCICCICTITQCPARVGFGQSRSEKWRKNVIHSFREVQVKKNDLRSRSRNESEMKMTENRDREVKVKWKSFEIEIEKWNFSRIFENLKRTDFDLSERVHLEVISFLYVIC